MTIRKTDGRRLLQISMQPDYYKLVQDHCRRLDVPMTVWARDLIRREIETESSPNPPLNP